MTKDMTKGSPVKLIIGFMLPVILGNVFQQIYSTVDTIIVGKFLGTNDLAAVGSTGSITFLIFGFCFGLTGGFAIPVSQTFGSKDFASLKRYVGNTLWLSIILAIVMTTLTAVFCMPILKAMNTPSNIIVSTYNYLFVIFLGIPVTIAYNTLAGLMRSLGDSKTPVFFLIIASLVNIVLDIVFIVNFNMGVAGAAWATNISQAVSSILCFIVILKKFDVLYLSKDDLKPRKRYIKRLLAMGIPMGLQFSITAIGSVILQTSVNALGSMYVAAITAGSKIVGIFSCICDSMGSTIATYSSQNLGAGNLPRIRKGLKISVIAGVSYGLAAFAVCILFGNQLISLFIEESQQDILALAYKYLIISAAFYWALSFVNIFRLLIQGVGYAKLAMVAGLMEMGARSILALLVTVLGYNAACFSGPFAWILADIFLIPAYFKVMDRLSHSIPRPKDDDTCSEECPSLGQEMPVTADN